MPFFENATRIGNDVKRHLLNLLFPPRCIVCRHLGTWLCVDCVSRLPFIAGPVCRRCGTPLPQGTLCARCRHAPPRMERIHSILLFEGPVRTAVHRLKYRDGRALAEPLGALMADWWDRHPLEVDLIVPVPLHPRRLRQRGYNQAALLARQLGRHAGLPVQEKALSRVRATPPQMRLSAEARRQNVRGAFRCTDEEEIAGRRVLLVDDVCTTGATLEACANALQTAGAAGVLALTLARTP